MKAVAAAVYGRAAAFRRAAYERGWLRSKTLESPSICVGNLTCGGTGKTPLVGYLAGLLARKGFQPVILSRGYRSPAESATVLVSDGTRILSGPGECGDEAYLLAIQNPASYVVAGKNRSRSIQAVQYRVEKPVFILDDGFQHLALRCRINLVLFDVTVPAREMQLLPAGRLREPLEALSRSSAVLLTRAHQASEQAESCRLFLQQFAPRAPFFSFGHRAVCFVDLKSRREIPLRELCGQKVIALAAIGHPAQFIRDLESLELDIVARHLFRDHHEFTPGQLDRVRDDAARHQARAIVTTEKDAVRIAAPSAEKQQILALRIEPVCFNEQEFGNWLMGELGIEGPEPERKAKTV